MLLESVLFQGRGDIQEIYHLATLTSGWKILDLPVEILSYAQPTSGLSYRYLRSTCKLFYRLLHKPLLIESHHQMIKPLIPKIVIANMAMECHVPSCDTAILYTHMRLQHVNVVYLGRCDTLIIENCNYNIIYLYYFLEQVKRRCNRIIIRHNYFPNTRSSYVKHIPDRIVHFHGNRYNIKNCMELDLPKQVYVGRVMYPDDKFFRQISTL